MFTTTLFHLQLCIWSIDGWEKKKSRFIQAPQSPLAGETRVQFHNDQTHILVVHESQIGIYDSRLECLRSVSLPRIIFLVLWFLFSSFCVFFLSFWELFYENMTNVRHHLLLLSDLKFPTWVVLQPVSLTPISRSGLLKIHSALPFQMQYIPVMALWSMLVFVMVLLEFSMWTTWGSDAELHLPLTYLLSPSGKEREH